jgi:hypothetical protein
MDQPGPIYGQSDLAAPKVFISSTFEKGLLGIRHALEETLERIGYKPAMSEAPDFTYGHGIAKAYEDAINSIKTAQIYVVLIGRRYGTVHPASALSITQMEYREARSHGIPSIVFVEDEVLDGWSLNRQGQVRARERVRWVDDIRVWRFIDEVMIEDGCPVFAFADERDVLRDLHAQLANLFGAFLRFDHGARRWLWTEARTGAFEVASSTVWVLSPDLYWDFQDEHYRALVNNNVIARRTLYRYLYRDNELNRSRVDDLRGTYVQALGPEETERLVAFAAIPEDAFWWCTEHVLFNAYTADERGFIVDICEDRDRSRKYDIEMGRSKRLTFRAQFERLWNLWGNTGLNASSVRSRGA